MEKKATYETLFIVDVNLGDEGVQNLIDRFKAMVEQNGEMTKTDDWGKRHLAYPINDLNEGYYYIMTYTAKPDFPAEIERVMHITDGILRSMTVRLGE